MQSKGGYEMSCGRTENPEPVGIDLVQRNASSSEESNLIPAGNHHTENHHTEHERLKDEDLSEVNIDIDPNRTDENS